MADYRLWPATSGPASSTADTPVNLGTEFYVTSVAWAEALHFWRADTAITGPVLGRIWQVDSPTTGTAVPGTDVEFILSGTGWQTAQLPAPVELVPDQRYRAVCLFPSGYSATADYWGSLGGSAGITNGPLVAPNATNAVGNDQGSFTYSASPAFPIGSFVNGGYWVDVTVTDIDPGAAIVGGRQTAAFLPSVTHIAAGATRHTASAGLSSTLEAM